MNVIRFVLDFEIFEIDFDNSKFTPTTTLLNFLRSLEGHKGTKEGCAEGDCGACTVVIGEFCNNQIHYKAVDSCLVFLPSIHGKMVVTVENLAEIVDNEIVLHPVQKAMVDKYGSQCGFCTPGFIMSMFALYKSRNTVDPEEISDALTGNLCRCTGYLPIKEAAIEACLYRKEDKFDRMEAKLVALLEEILSEKCPVIISTQTQSYFRPSRLDDALSFRQNHPNALIVSGSTDVALRVTKKHELLPEILDISDVSELNFFKLNENEVEIGAVFPLEQLRKRLSGTFPALEKILFVFGSRQIRNVATLGGNIGSASPIGDTLPVLLALNAEVCVESSNNSRKVPLSDFIIGYRKTAIRENELIVRIVIPVPDKETILKSYKVSKRKDLDISTCSGAFRLKINSGKKVEELILAFGGMAAHTKRAVQTEAFLMGKIWDEANVTQAAKILESEFTPLSDARSGAGFRSIAARNLLLKFFEESNSN